MTFISDFSLAVGALLGLAIGDALGAPLEGEPPPVHPVFEYFPGGQVFRLAGSYTDDTLQALALAESLAACCGYSPADLIPRLLVDFRSHTRLYGPTSRAVFNLLERGVSPARAAGLVHSLHGRSRSNGSVMRGPPIGIFYRGPEVEACSISCSRLTHQDPVAGSCSSWINRMVSDLSRGCSRNQAFTRALHRCREEEVAAVLGKFRSFDPVPGLDALEASHSAITVFMEERGFEATLGRAVSMGGDSDTVGAIAGSLAGAYYGFYCIPSRWIDGLRGSARVWRAAVNLWRAAPF